MRVFHPALLSQGKASTCLFRCEVGPMDPDVVLHQMRLKVAYLQADHFARLLSKQALTEKTLHKSEDLQQKLSDAIDEVIRLEQGARKFTQSRTE